MQKALTVIFFFALRIVAAITFIATIVLWYRGAEWGRVIPVGIIFLITAGISASMFMRWWCSDDRLDQR